MLDTCGFVPQKLKEAAAHAEEEEQRRLQTQKELQESYRMELDREKMVLCMNVFPGNCAMLHI